MRWYVLTVRSGSGNGDHLHEASAFGHLRVSPHASPINRGAGGVDLCAARADGAYQSQNGRFKLELTVSLKTSETAIAKRENEIAEPRLQDLAKNAEMQGRHLDIGTEAGRSIKTASSRRKVPLHPLLIEAGIL